METAGPPRSRRGTIASLWRVAALVTLVALIWIGHYGLWTPADWAVPLDYSGDTHEMLTRIKAASEGDTWPLAPQVLKRLGAPWGAHWNGYPTPDKLLVLAMGGLARWIGVGAAANVAVLLAAMSAAAAFYWVARRLRAAWEWAFAGALLFAFTYSVFHRGLAHLLLLYTWTIPVGLLCCWLVARRRPFDWTSPESMVCLFAALALGLSNPYHLFFWIQLLIWAIVFQAVRHRRINNLKIGIACLAVAGLAFLAMHAEFWLYTQTGTLPLLVRNYGGTEMYALKAVEMFIPPPVHRWEPLAFFGQRYGRWSEWRGESFLPYLGVVGIAALVWLLADSVLRMLRGRAPSGFALQTGWILSYSSLGGITNLLALFFGFQIFRATNRIAIFISCLALLFLALRMSRHLRRFPRGVSLGAAALVSLLGVLDQIPRRSEPERRALLVARVEADAHFGRTLESALPRGAMVFQLPVLGFPEVKPPHRLADYELFRPYLHTTSLRFSYGGAKFRSRGRWQRDLEELPPEELVRSLERYGFSALYLNRKGFTDGGEALLSSLAKLGYQRRLESPRKEQVVVLLNPATEAELPLGRTLTFGEGWYSQAVDQGGESVRWSHGPAVLTYFNPHDTAREVTLHFRLCAGSPRAVRLQHRGRTLTRITLDGEPKDLQPLPVLLHPGVNRFDLISDEPPASGEGTAARLRAVGLIAVTVEAPAPKPGARPAEPGLRPGSRSS
ncbi:MAG: hypothetical protein JNN01_24490 [Opitutaceae bacterium]|nr:hypothetical protein [Opitutaceae bacterium]